MQSWVYVLLLWRRFKLAWWLRSYDRCDELQADFAVLLPASLPGKIVTFALILPALGAWLHVLGIFAAPCADIAKASTYLRRTRRPEGCAQCRQHCPARQYDYGCEVALPISGVLTLCILASDAFWQAPCPMRAR